MFHDQGLGAGRKNKVMEFTELNLQEPVAKGIGNAGFTTCTSVQELALPVGLKGKDLIVRSKTGSGKTAVFVLTFLERYLEAKAQGKSAKALVISPTRELAQQIAEDAAVLASGIPDFKIGCFYGGVGYEKQEKDAHEGLDLYVGTPGRLLDFKRSGKIRFDIFTDVIIDEADRVFDMGFLPDIKAIFAGLVDKTQRQTMLFSATMSVAVQNIAWSYMNEPEVINACPEEITVKEITQEIYHVTKSIKFGILLSILAKEKPKSALIFTNMKFRTVEVCERLKLNGYNSAYLMGDMPQSKRLTTLQRMKEGKIDILVATDVAARGLQIDDLEMVINYDIPEDYENYVHRIGRTARAGKSGKAVTLACEEYVYGLEDIEKYIQMKIPVCHYDDLPVVEDKSQGRRWSQRPERAPRPASSSYTRSPRRPESKPSYSPRTEASKPSQQKRGPAPARRRSDDVSTLSSMDSRSRMDYYRKQYAASDLNAQEQRRSNPPRQKQAYDPKAQEQRMSNPPRQRQAYDPKAQEQRKSNPPRQRQAYEKKASQAAPMAKPAAQKPEPVKKPGFFERLFGLRKKK
jgi:ATP-dependent RNA helicase RhlB